MRGLLSLAAAAALVAAQAPVPSVTCNECQAVVAALQQVAENATTLAQIQSVLETGCTVLDGIPIAQQLCDDVTQLAVKALPFIDEQLATVAWNIPLGFCSTFIPVCQLPCCSDPVAPEQLRLSLTGDLTSMTISWVTLNATASSTVQWGLAGGALSNSSAGTSWTYTQGGWLGNIHSATMTGLARGATYQYRVGSPEAAWSSVFQFTTIAADAGMPGTPLKVATVGDMAYDNNSDATIAALTALANDPANAGYFFVVHIGDVGYADGFAPHDDAFSRKIQPIAASVPYMTVQGNHELWYNFAAFQNRYRATPPVYLNGTAIENNSTFYSVEVGPLHLTLFDTETAIDTADVSGVQAQWLQQDLANADAKRAAGVPWVVAGGHRPLFCTNGGYPSKSSDCGIFASILQDEIQGVFTQTKTDLVLAAHMHGYERMTPIADSLPMGPAASNYSSPIAPIYIVNGAAGNREGNEDPSGNAPWSVPGAHTGAIGYGLLTVQAGPNPGDTFLRADFYVSADGSLFDSVTITK